MGDGSAPPGATGEGPAEASVGVDAASGGPEEATLPADPLVEAGPPVEVPATMPSEPELPDQSDRIDAVLLEIERLNVALEELTRLGQRQMEHIDRLHAENQQLRAGELRQAMSPLLRSLVRHHDNVAKMVEAAGSDASEVGALTDVRAGLLSVFRTAGVEAFEVELGERFDASRHQGVGRSETDEVALDGAVAGMRRCGFVADDGRIVRPAEVDVYRLR